MSDRHRVVERLACRRRATCPLPSDDPATIWSSDLLFVVTCSTTLVSPCRSVVRPPDNFRNVPLTGVVFLHFSSLQSVKYSKKRPKVLYFKSIMRTLLSFLLRLPSAAENDFACIMQGRVGARTSEKVRREMLAVLCERQTGKKSTPGGVRQDVGGVRISSPECLRQGRRK